MTQRTACVTLWVPLRGICLAAPHTCGTAASADRNELWRESYAPNGDH
jgi:hypothetical protein